MKGVILVGIVGSFLGSWLWNSFIGDGNQGLIGSLILGILGSMLVLFMLRKANV